MSDRGTHDPDHDSRLDSRLDPGLDPRLEQWLARARADEEDVSPPPDVDVMFDTMFDAVKGDIERAEKKPTFWLRTRPTWMRRLIASIAAALVVGLGGAVGLRGDFADYPLPTMAAACVALGALLLLSLHQALRPMHEPPMSPLARAGFVALTLGATFTLALISPPEAPTEALLSPCLFYGLLMGVPVYLVLRLLDRGPGATAALLAACAAGLAGNLVLQLHCPRDGVEHLMVNHFSVAALFVAGLGIVHVVARRLRR